MGPECGWTRSIVVVDQTGIETWSENELSSVENWSEGFMSLVEARSMLASPE